MTPKSDKPAPQAQPPADLPSDDISYENARAELNEVVRQLEAGGQSLEDSLALWQRGEDLAAVCQRWLDAAGRRLDAAIIARDAHPGD